MTFSHVTATPVTVAKMWEGPDKVFCACVAHAHYSIGRLRENGWGLGTEVAMKNWFIIAAVLVNINSLCKR